MYQLQLRILENKSTELGASVVLESDNLMDLVNAVNRIAAENGSPVPAAEPTPTARDMEMEKSRKMLALVISAAKQLKSPGPGVMGRVYERDGFNFTARCFKNQAGRDVYHWEYLRGAVDTPENRTGIIFD